MTTGGPFNGAAARVRTLLTQLRLVSQQDRIEAELAARARELDAEEFSQRVETRSRTETAWNETERPGDPDLR